MEIRILYNPDKTVSIVYPVSASRGPKETRKEWLARVFAKANPQGLPFEDTNTSKLPETREKRNLWRGEKGKKVWIEEAAPA